MFEQEFKNKEYKMINFIAKITSSSIMLVQKWLVNTERVEIYTLEYFIKTRNLKLFLRSNVDADELYQLT